MSVHLLIEVRRAIKPRLVWRKPWTTQRVQVVSQHIVAPGSLLDVRYPFGREIHMGDGRMISGIAASSDVRKIPE